MATLPVRPLTRMQRMMGGIALFRPEGSNKWIKIGPVDSVEFTPNITTVDVYTNEFGDRRLLRKITTTKEGTVVLNGISAWTEWLYQALFMSKPKYLTQAAVVSDTLIVEDVVAGDIVELPGKKGTVSAVTDGATGVYVEDTHYTFHPQTGVIEFLAIPAGATADVEIEYSLPAITAADKLIDLSILETSGTRGEFRYIGHCADVGEDMDMRLSDVEFQPNGAISAGDTANNNVGSLTGAVYTTATKGYGSLQGLETIVNA